MVLKINWFRFLEHPCILLASLIFLAASTQPVNAGFLNRKANFFEERLEKNFRPFGPVINLHYDFYQPDKAIDVEGTGDSAIWTGVYLGSQCLKYSQINNVLEGAETRKLIHNLLGVIENLFWVTGKHGLLARFAFDPNSEIAKNYMLKGRAKPEPGSRWQHGKGVGLENWLWLGDTSRDQYIGIFFGLSTCYKNMPKFEDKLRINRIVEYGVTRVYNEDWTIPEVPKRAWLPATAANEYMRLMLLQTVANTSGKAHWRERYERNFYNFWERFKREQGPTFLSNYFEYYAWNLRYLTFYALIQNELKSELKNNYIKYVKEMMWPYTKTHKNTLFTFIKLNTVGVSNPLEDLIALNEAQESLTQLMEKDRRDLAVINSYRLDLGRDPYAKKLYDQVSKYDPTGLLYIIGHGQMAARPMALAERPNVDYYWHTSPQELDHQGHGNMHYPAVDAIVAYWLGRSSGLIAEQD